MSIASYDRKVDRGIAGPTQPVCFVAAVEQLVPYSIPDHMYKEYADFIEWYGSLRRVEREKRNAEYEEIFDKVFSYVGGLTCKDVYFTRANTARGLAIIVNRLLRDGFQVAVDVADGKGCHTIGLLPVQNGEYFALTGTHVPPKLPQIAGLRDIAPHLFFGVERHMERFPFNDANVIGIPPLD